MPKELYMCQLCANHGIYNQPKKGHKQVCPRRDCPCDLCGLNTKRRALDQIERQMKNTSTTIGIGVKKYNELNHTNSNADESNAINHDDIVSASAMNKIGDHRSPCHDQSDPLNCNPFKLPTSKCFVDNTDTAVTANDQRSIFELTSSTHHHRYFSSSSLPIDDEKLSSIYKRIHHRESSSTSQSAKKRRFDATTKRYNGTEQQKSNNNNNNNHSIFHSAEKLAQSGSTN